MNKRAIILGLDGLDPRLSERWMDAGLLPHLARLRERGVFSPLTTTNPPETAAAWAAFATGQNPGKTGIFDFITRDPQTYTILPAMVTLVRQQESRPSELVSARHGISLWKILGDHGLQAAVLNLPVTWPPEPFDGQLLSGMGTPDLLGTAGRATCYSTAIAQSRLRSNLQEVAIRAQEGVVETTLPGPHNQSLPLRFQIDAAARQVTATVQGNSVRLQEKGWSDWCEVRFRLEDKEVVGLCRFCLLEIEPEIRIYASPLQSHPRQPHVPISHPASFAQELYRALGPFRTQGREVDIFSLLGGALDDDVLLDDTFRALEERERMTQHLLRQANDLVISWIGVVDTTQHGYWRFMDPAHPLYAEEGRRRYGDAIQRVYQWLDGMVGRLIEAMDQEAFLLIVSDHGCAGWRRSVHLNTWLWREGYLALKEGQEGPAGQPAPFPGDAQAAVPFSQVDWPRTRAYAVGCGKIYVNLRGREGQGRVSPGAEAAALEDELIARLLAWRDPADGQAVVNAVYRSRDVQWGPHMHRAPELIVGLRGGYRVAWSSMSWISRGEPLVDNLGKVSGDHISMDYALVPGTLLSNARLDLGRGAPHLVDVAPTVLDYFGLEAPADMDGRSRWPGR